MNIRYTISIKEKYALVRFTEGEEFRAQQFQSEMAAVTADGGRFVALDFTALPRLDVNLLMQIDPTVRAIRATKRKFALCCASPTIRTVLEVTGLIGADSILFPSVGELEKHVQTYLAALPKGVRRSVPKRQPAESQPAGSAAPDDLHKAKIPASNRLLPGGLIACAALVLAVLIIQVTTMQQLKEIHVRQSDESQRLIRVEHLVDSLNVSASESQVLAELDAAPTDTASQRIARVAALADDYAQQSPRLRLACRDLSQAQRRFRKKNGACAVQPAALGWTPSDPALQVQFESGATCRATLTQTTIHGMSLSFTVNTMSGTLEGVP